MRRFALRVVTYIIVVVLALPGLAYTLLKATPVTNQLDNLRGVMPVLAACTTFGASTLQRFSLNKLGLLRAHGRGEREISEYLPLAHGRGLAGLLSVAGIF